MPVHILCPECGEDLGEIYLAYEAVKNAYFDKELSKHNVSVDIVNLVSNILPNLTFIFDALHINNQCCRIHIIGTTDFDL